MFPWKLKHIQNLFRHKFSLLMMCPTQCGKTFFVEKTLTTDRILYESKKPRRIWWYFSQWQDTYKVMQSSMGKEIEFFRGLQSFKKIFGKLTHSLTMCWCLMILWPKQQIVLSFPFCLPKAGIEMLV